MQRLPFLVEDVPLAVGIASSIELQLCQPIGTLSVPQGLSPAQAQWPIVDSSLRPSLASSKHSASLGFGYPTELLLPCPHACGSLWRKILRELSSQASRRFFDNVSTFCDTVPIELAPSSPPAAGGARIFTQLGRDDWRIAFLGAEV